MPTRSTPICDDRSGLCAFAAEPGLEISARAVNLMAMRVVALSILLLILASTVRADERALQFLEDRYTHALLHQVGPEAEGLPPALGRADCTGLRTLSRQQRNHARTLGRVFERSGIHIDLILSSRWCQSIATAQLLELRPVKEDAMLDAWGQAEDQAGKEQTEAVLDLLDGIRPSETALLVTHGANIKALTGLDTVAGDVIVLRLRPGNDPEIRGRFQVE